MIKQAVTAVRKAVASVIAFVAFVLDRSARQAARLAGRIYVAPPLAVIPVRPLDPNEKPPRYTVLRWQGNRHWTAYDGFDGGAARRSYEAVQQAKETGRMEFQMTIPGGYVVRGVYENGE